MWCASHACKPLVPEVLPVPAGADRLEDDLVHPLHHLVTELDRRVEAHRRALFAGHLRAVAAKGEDRLRMLGGLAVPTRVVADRRSILAGLSELEAAELDEPGSRVRAAQAGDLGHAHAFPGGYRGPAFDAVMAHAELRCGEPAQIGERKLERPGD